MKLPTYHRWIFNFNANLKEKLNSTTIDTFSYDPHRGLNASLTVHSPMYCTIFHSPSNV